MRPKRQADQTQRVLFDYTTLDEMCNRNHPLFKLANLIDWSLVDRECNPLYCNGLGSPAKPTRLLVSLHYLKYTYNLSDKETVNRWVETPYWQYFSGGIMFRKEFPIRPSTMMRRRHVWTKNGSICF